MHQHGASMTYRLFPLSISQSVPVLPLLKTEILLLKTVVDGRGYLCIAPDCIKEDKVSDAFKRSLDYVPAPDLPIGYLLTIEPPCPLADDYWALLAMREGQLQCFLERQTDESIFIMMGDSIKPIIGWKNESPTPEQAFPTVEHIQALVEVIKTEEQLLALVETLAKSVFRYRENMQFMLWDALKIVAMLAPHRGLCANWDALRRRLISHWLLMQQHGGSSYEREAKSYWSFRLEIDREMGRWLYPDVLGIEFHVPSITDHAIILKVQVVNIDINERSQTVLLADPKQTNAGFVMDSAGDLHVYIKLEQSIELDVSPDGFLGIISPTGSPSVKAGRYWLIAYHDDRAQHNRCVLWERTIDEEKTVFDDMMERVNAVLCRPDVDRWYYTEPCFFVSHCFQDFLNHIASHGETSGVRELISLLKEIDSYTMPADAIEVLTYLAGNREGWFDEYEDLILASVDDSDFDYSPRRSLPPDPDSLQSVLGCTDEEYDEWYHSTG